MIMNIVIYVVCAIFFLSLKCEVCMFSPCKLINGFWVVFEELIITINEKKLKSILK